MHVIVRAKTPGVQRIEGTLEVYVCSNDWCRNMQQSVAVSVPIG